MQLPEFKTAITGRIDSLGGNLSEDALCRETKACRDAIYADSPAHDGHIEDPFFNFVISGGITAFTFFESEFAIYAFECDEAKLIAQTERFALANTQECKSFLAVTYGKSTPDIVVPRSIAEYWLDGN